MAIFLCKKIYKIRQKNPCNENVFVIKYVQHFKERGTQKMICTVNTHVIGLEQKTSQKTGNTYFVLNFVDGAKPVSLMVKEGTDITRVQPFKKMNVTVEVEMGRYMKATVIGIKE